MVTGTHGEAGFTLVEALVVAAVVGVLAAAAGPILGSSMRLYALNSSAQTVASAIRSARYTAVSRNRAVRVRFNCPAANQFRMVEVVGTAVDSAAARCSEAAYPYPDPDATTAPDVDGPMVLLPSDAQFGTADDLEIDATGRVSRLTGCPTCVTAAAPATVVVSNGSQTRTITVSANGQVLLQ